MASRNRGALQLEDENGNVATLPTATKTGWTFGGWFDANNQLLSADTIGQGKLFTAQWVDDILPTISAVSVTTNFSASQTATITASDEGSGIAGYYIGQTDPSSGVTFTTSSTGTINAPGTWYFAVKDGSGNIKKTTKTFYKATLDVDGGTSSVTSVIAESGKTISLSNIAKTGYTSNGWSTTYGATSGSTTWMATSNVSLYPVWKANQYTVTFNANGGSCTTGSKIVTYGGTYGNLPTPTRSGYSFDGWFTDPTGGSQIVSQTTVYSTNNHSLFAHWTQNTYVKVLDATSWDTTSNRTYTIDVSSDFTSISNAYCAANNAYGSGDGTTNSGALNCTNVWYSGTTIYVTLNYDPGGNVYFRGTVSIVVEGVRK